MKHFSIIIPTLNEAKNIIPLLEKITETTEKHEMDPEIIFVDDGSTDGTRDIIAEYGGTLTVRLICRQSSPGLARSVVAGASAATRDTVVVMDADLSHSPEMIPHLLRPLTENTSDMVIGSRFVKGASTPGLSSLRRTASVIASGAAALFTNVKDPLSGFFAISRHRLCSVQETGSGFKIALEVLAGAEPGFRVSEVPISFLERLEGSSKMNAMIMYEYFKQLLRIAGFRCNGNKVFSSLEPGLWIGALDLGLLLFLSFFGTRTDTGHIASLIIAAHSFLILSSVLKRERVFKRKKDYLNFLVVLVPGVFLRGGILGFLADLQAISFLTAVCYLASGWIVSTAALAAMKDDSLLPSAGGNWTRSALLLIGYSILLRFFYLGGPELLEEEAYYWNYSQHLAPGYLDHPPAVALLIKLGTTLFGHNEFGVRIGAFGCWFIAAVFVYKLSSRLLGRNSALRSLILFSMLPIFFGSGFIMTPDAPLIACWAGALYFFYRALAEDHPISWYSAGLLLGLGMCSKYTIVFLGPAVILFMLVYPPARKQFFRPHPYLAAMLALAVFSPVIWWNYHNEWASFLFQSKTRIQSDPEFSTHLLVISILLLLTPTGFFAVASMFRDKLSEKQSAAIVRTKLFTFCMITALVPLTIFLLFSVTKEVKLNWTGPVWISLLPLMAQAMQSRSPADRRLSPRLWPRTILFLTFGYGFLLHYSAIGLPMLSYPDKPFLFGWDDFAARIEKKVQEFEEKEGRRPMVAGTDKYQTASGLAFYRFKALPDDMKQRSVTETTGRHLFGHEALMYGFWTDPAEIEARDILVVSPDKNRLRPTFFASRHHALGPIQEVSIEKRGKKVGTYYYRLVKGYHQPPPSLVAQK